MQGKEPNAIKIFIFTEGAVCLSPKKGDEKLNSMTFQNSGLLQ